MTNPIFLHVSGSIVVLTCGETGQKSFFHLHRHQISSFAYQADNHKFILTGETLPREVEAKVMANGSKKVSASIFL
jgi:diadenosine tetraphosphate (Ap4A) HIT family hydrolase